MIRTERLILREWRDEDAAPFAAINADPVVNEFLPGPLSRAESDEMMARIRGHVARHGFGINAVELAETGEMIGAVGFSVPSFDAPFMPAAEIGWRIGRAHWGRGYAPEAAKATVADAAERLGLETMVAFTVPHNVRSRRVMEKIGLVHDPDGDFDHPVFAPGHPLRRHVLYRHVGRG